MIRRAIIIAATLTIGAGIAVAARRGSNTKACAVCHTPDLRPSLQGRAGHRADGGFLQPRPLHRSCPRGKAVRPRLPQRPWPRLHGRGKGDFITYLKEQ